MASIITKCMQLISNKQNINPHGRALIRKAAKISSRVSSICTHCSIKIIDLSPTTKRRSGNYGASNWDFEFIQSLNSEYSGISHSGRAYVLKMEVKKMLDDASMKVMDRLELIDDLQRLGISYHFENEIKQILTAIYHQNYHILKNNNYTNGETKKKDLYSTALEFRLLRQHGFGVSEDTFDCFKNEKGEFKASFSNDTPGLLQLYEASRLLTEGENTLELARNFSTKLLQQISVDLGGDDHHMMRLLVSNALEMPLQWRVPRPNSRWFIETYEKRSADKKNSFVLELAKLDFNIVQATHQQELKETSRHCLTNYWFLLIFDNIDLFSY